ncbi:MAG: hypothetical protein DCC75_03280 [Proteobacteria bacterium]|nr:MAG: hypothetical protein DCC75_03280 [Pseudomonadota bacterium]
MSLDELDRRLLFELDQNSRQSIADLSRVMRLSRDRVLYRMKKLQNSGVLKGFSTAVNVQKLGLFVYKTYLRLEKNQGSFEPLIDHLHNHPLVDWIAETEGDWDLVFSIYGRNPFEFHSVQREIISKYSEVISQYNVYTLVEAYIFKKNFLVGRGQDSVYYGGKPAGIKYDEVDIEILRLLSEDSRLTKAEIGLRLDINPMVVKYRIDKLEESQVILGYPIEIDFTKMGMLTFKLQLHLARYTKVFDGRLQEYAKTNPYVTLLIRQIGDCAWELELEVESYHHLNDIITELRTRFSREISSIDSIFIKQQRYKWVPFNYDYLQSEDSSPSRNLSDKNGAQSAASGR